MCLRSCLRVAVSCSVQPSLVGPVLLQLHLVCLLCALFVNEQNNDGDDDDNDDGGVQLINV